MALNFKSLTESQVDGIATQKINIPSDLRTQHFDYIALVRYSIRGKKG